MFQKVAGRWRRRCVILAVVLIVGLYYRWNVLAANGPFEFGYTLTGFYNYLGQAFANGHLYLPIKPSPQLLALADPYDPGVSNTIRYQDTVLYGGRYYLYFGAAPAVLLFTPWRLLTGTDLPEHFAALMLCFGGFLFACAALLRVLRLAGVQPSLPLLTALLLGLGFCQSIPFLLNRVGVYEIAIAGGYFCLSGAIYFLARALPAARATWLWLAASGLSFGAAVACRPHLVLAGLIAAVALTVLLRRTHKRALFSFLAAWIFAGALIAVYNYQRFGNPAEFGFRYQLGGPGHNRVELATRNLVPGAYYMLLSRPEFSRVFPWMRMVLRFPFDSAERHPLPPQYFVEPTVGALWLVPFLPFALWLPGTRRLARAAVDSHAAEVRTILWICTASALAILLFLVSTHLATHRYEVDFVPLAVFPALASLGIRVATAPGRGSTVLLAVAIAFSMLANLALGIAGPYDDILRTHPATYVHLARWFSPASQFRPLLNPVIDVQLAARFVPEPPGFREPLITLGRNHYVCFLYAEHAPGILKMILQSGDQRAVYEMPDPGNTEISIALSYSSQAGSLAAAVDGRPVLALPVAILVAAPSQLAIGENGSDPGLTQRTFTGQLRVVGKSVVDR